MTRSSGTAVCPLLMPAMLTVSLCAAGPRFSYASCGDYVIVGSRHAVTPSARPSPTNLPDIDPTVIGSTVHGLGDGNTTESNDDGDLRMLGKSRPATLPLQLPCGRTECGRDRGSPLVPVASFTRPRIIDQADRVMGVDVVPKRRVRLLDAPLKVVPREGYRERVDRPPRV